MFPMRQSYRAAMRISLIFAGYVEKAKAPISKDCAPGSQ